MTTRFGVSVPDDLADDIERLRRTEDADGRPVTRPRSDVVRELVRIGLAATEVIEEAEDFDLDPGRPRETWVRQAALNQLARERE